MKRTLFSVLVLIISLTALGFSLIKITPFSINGDTFIGIIATFIGISVTLLIGYQILNYFEIRKDLNEIKKAKSEISATQNRISRLEYEVQENLDIIAAKFISSDQGRCVDAFLKQQGALIFSLKARRKDFEFILGVLKEYITKMEPGYFATGTKVQVEEKIAQYIEESKKIDSQIKAFDNYCIIKYEYERIMQCFYNRLENAKNGLIVSSEERKEIWR